MSPDGVPSPESLRVGEEIGSRNVALRRADLVQYAGASGDMNPIHWSERYARAAGLPGVIAHGMLTMGVAVQLVVDWLPNIHHIDSYRTRFTRVVPIPDDDEGIFLEIRGTVGACDPDKRTARIDLFVALEQKMVLTKAQVAVRFSDKPPT